MKPCETTIHGSTGGNGDQKQLNVAAFGNAYRRYASETEVQMAEKSRADVAKLGSDYQALRDQYDQSQRELNAANNAIQGHLATINRLDRENTIYRLTRKRRGVHSGRCLNHPSATLMNTNMSHPGVWLRGVREGG